MSLIISLLSKIGYVNVFRILSYCLCFSVGIYCCHVHYSLEIDKYKIEAEKQRNQLLQDVAKSEKEARDKITSIERDNLQEKEKLKNEYETTISKLRSDYVINDSVQCNSTRTDSVSATATNTGSIKCFTEDELYRKIERSLAITQECDRLASDYNALLKICKVE